MSPSLHFFINVRNNMAAELRLRAIRNTCQVVVVLSWRVDVSEPRPGIAGLDLGLYDRMAVAISRMSRKKKLLLELYNPKPSSLRRSLGKSLIAELTALCWTECLRVVK